MLLLLLAVAVSSGCTEHANARFPTASKLPDGKRRPDAVAVDLASEPPAWQATSESKDGLMTLRTPLGVTVALRTIKAFLSAVVREDMSDMSAVLHPGAQVSNTRTGSKSYAQNMTYMWRRRFQKRKFELLSNRLVYRSADVMTYRPEHLEALPVNVRMVAAKQSMNPGDLLMRVPIATTSVRNQRLLGDEIVFWLRRKGDRFVIYHMAEDVPF